MSAPPSAPSPQSAAPTRSVGRPRPCGRRRRSPLPRLPARLRLLADPLLALTQLRRELVTEVVGLERRTDLDGPVLALGVRDPLHPLDRLVHRPDLPDPVAGEELLRLRE